MKLSMWMIANRLSSLMDIRCNIRDEAAPVLNSARLVYATNCVHVCGKGDCIVYDGEGDTISVYGITIKEAFEILQGVFDYFQDWESETQAAARQGDFQKVIDLSWVVFQNPMILLDANNKLLGISRQIPPEEMDTEWQYLCRYGYSSLGSVRMMKYDYREIDFNQSGSQTYHFRANNRMNYGGASYCMTFGGIPCGRLTILDKNRKLNTGDYQLMQKLSLILEPALSVSVQSRRSGINVFYSLLFDKPYQEKELQLMMTYQQWMEEDTYQLLLLLPDEQTERESTLSLLANTVTRRMSDCIVLKEKHGVIVLANGQMSADPNVCDFFRSLCLGSPVHAGFSLPMSGLKGASSMRRQAQAAVRLGLASSPEKPLFFFADYAIPYLLSCDSRQQQLDACHPVIRRLWQEKRLSRDDLFDTLKIFLDCERSLNRSSSRMFTHRNTVLYRIKKCETLLQEDLEDPKVRYYLRLSMFILEHFSD